MIGWHTGGPRTDRLLWTPDGRRLVSANYRGRTVRLWHPDGTPAGEFRFHGSVLAITSTPDGRHLLVAVWRRPVSVCDVRTGAEVGALDAGPTCTGLAVSPDGAVLVAATWAGVAWWRDRATGFADLHPMATPRYRDDVFRVAADQLLFTPDGRHLLTNGVFGPCVLDSPPTRCVRRVGGPRAGVNPWSGTSLAVSPDGRWAATTRRAWDVSVWPVDAPARPVRLPGLTRDRSVRGLAFTAGDRVLAAGSDGRVRCWDPATATERPGWAFGRGGLRSLAVAPDGLTAAAGTAAGEVVVWDL